MFATRIDSAILKALTLKKPVSDLTQEAVRDLLNKVENKDKK